MFNTQAIQQAAIITTVKAECKSSGEVPALLTSRVCFFTSSQSFDTVHSLEDKNCTT